MIELKYDDKIDIATGRHRRETSWKNKEWRWSALVHKLSVTHRTAETYAEYIGAKKSRQDEIKDVGGFVGGYLTNGKRKSGTVAHRQLITLDIDFAEIDLWESFTMMYGNAAALYSTHKHSPETPRYRLIIPLDRAVFTDEYEAIARKIASILGIDLFDHTTFQPSRLMYFPSTSKDGVFEFQYQDGEWLSADEILNSYRNWQDTSEWAVSSKEGDLVQHAIKKQGDPLEKQGIIGAWCRTYTIHDVIDKFLVDVYDSCDVDNRYTYKEGSTSAGLVVYDDKYAYSHHGTDPVSGKLCNAFDLVRIHKFGLKDEDAREGTPSNKMPSYTAMLDFTTEDVLVRKQLGSERLKEAGEAFSDEFNEDEEVNDEWLAEMEVDRKGTYLSTINNVKLILENDPKLKDCFAKDVFEMREVVKKPLHWRKNTSKYMLDVDEDGVTHYIEKTYDISSTVKVRAALNLVLEQNSYHPVRDYLNGLKWDGVKRVDSLFIDYLGAEDNEYTRAITRKALAAAVTRIFRPGTKFDYIVVFVGEQGQGKSQIIDKLGKEWFSDSLSTIEGTKAYEQIQGVWLVEMAELSALKKTEVEHAKHFISKREDRYRVAYGRRTENFPRQCIFFGTSNTKGFMRDATGGRRFWAVDTHVQPPTKLIYEDLTEDEINQIWAEAVVYYKQGETLYLNKELETFAYEVQKEHSERDERSGLIQKYLDTLLPENWDDLDIYQRRGFMQGDELAGKGTIERKRVCIAEIWCECLGGTQKEMTTFNTKDLHNIMRQIDGWEESKVKIKNKFYGVLKGYQKCESRVKKVVATGKINLN